MPDTSQLEGNGLLHAAEFALKRMLKTLLWGTIGTLSMALGSAASTLILPPM